MSVVIRDKQVETLEGLSCQTMEFEFFLRTMGIYQSDLIGFDILERSLYLLNSRA